MRHVRTSGAMPYIQEIEGTIIRSFVPHSLCLKERDDFYRCLMRYGGRWVFMNFDNLDHMSRGPKRFHIYAELDDRKETTMRDMFMDMDTHEWPMWGMTFMQAHDFTDVTFDGMTVNVGAVCVTADRGNQKWFYINRDGDFCGRYYPVSGMFGGDRNGSPVEVNPENDYLKEICTGRWKSMRDRFLII